MMAKESQVDLIDLIGGMMTLGEFREKTARFDANSILLINECFDINGFEQRIIDKRIFLNVHSDCLDKYINELQKMRKGRDE